MESSAFFNTKLDGFGQAKEAGIEKSIIDEAEVTLESLSATKKLLAAMKSRDPTALVQETWETWGGKHENCESVNLNSFLKTGSIWFQK